MDKKHKMCVQDVINKLKMTHNSFKEYPINRGGDFHFLDCVSFPHKDKEHLFKPLATECENSSNKYNRESNKLDLLEWKKHYPEGEIAQISDASEIDINKLKKNNFGSNRFRPIGFNGGYRK